MKVWIQMTQREGRTAKVLVMIWLSLLLVTAVTPLEWKWFFSYSVIGLIAYIIFGEYKYRKGEHEAKKPQKNDKNDTV